MATDMASADAEKKPDTDTRPKAVEEKHDGAGAAPTMPPVRRAAGTSLGQRQVQAKSAHGNARVGDGDDPAERHADMAADHVMRELDTSPGPSGASPSAPASAPAPAPAAASAPAAAPDARVRRTEDPAAEQRLPGAETAKPATPGSGAAPGAGPDTMTPAGPAPLVAAPATAGSRPAETGTPAPEPEPPAPEGEAPARETPQVPNDVQEYLDASRGQGAPLPGATRKLFESRFQRPFDDVRIHDDAGADDAARKIDALAFTRGNDIYFRSSAYDPTSQPGKKLLAHELAHVVQQRPGINRKTSPGLGGAIIRRVGDSKGAAAKSKHATKGGSEINFEKGTSPRIRLANVRVPGFKVRYHQGKKLFWNKKQFPDGKIVTPRLGTHEKAWRDAASVPLKRAVEKRGGQAKPPYRYEYAVSQRFYIGNTDDIAYALAALPWDKDKKPTDFDIDHKHELMLGGAEDDVKNLWLLDRGINRSSGPTIENAITKDIGQFLEDVRPELVRVPDIREIKAWAATSNDAVTFGGAIENAESKGKAAAQGASAPHWNLKPDDDNPDDAIIETRAKDLDFLKPLKDLTKGNRATAVGVEEQIVIYSKVGGGKAPRLVKRNPKDGTLKPIYGRGYATEEGAIYSKKTAEEAGVGSVTLKPFSRKKDGSPIPAANRPIDPIDPALMFPINPMPGVDWGGLLDTSGMAKLARELRSQYASPISLSSIDFDLDEGFQARGTIPRPSIPLLANVQIDLFVAGADIGLQAMINGGDLKLPDPFKVSGGVLILSASVNEGLKVEGDVNFEIQNVATGFIKAKKGTSAGFALDAELQFDKRMFGGDAKVKGSYEDGKWAVEGNLALRPGGIKGIKAASVAVKVTDDAVTADGEFETDLKGVEKGKVGLRYSQAAGMEITGEIILGQGIPGIKSGKLDATVREGPTGHSLSGGVTLEPSVPGLTGTVTGRYEDGAFSVDADLGYEKGLAKGTVHVGVTNQAVGEDSKPAGPPKADGSITAFGTGTVGLTLTPWLRGTVGLKLTPKGEVEVSGKVELPSSFEVFRLPPLEKEIFSVDVHVPIVGVSALGVDVGIFATVGGGATVSAGIGPGVLRDASLKVTYNPARPEDTAVTGSGTFAVPAHAGLRLTVSGGVGAGIPLVDAKATLNAHGDIGVAGEVSASGQVTWTPSTGVVLDARGDIFAEPRFKFGLDASVKVTIGAWRFKETLYEHTWGPLADFEFGSGLRFGLSLPVHYESMKPFDIAYDQIQWTYPHVEPEALLTGLMKQLVGSSNPG